MNDNLEMVILVDCEDRQIGVGEKLTSHRTFVRHRALSIFAFDGDGNILLQQRAPGEYHSGGMWSNVCCSHPRPGEEINDAAARRLYEEMGLQSSLRHMGRFEYRASLDGGWVEHEIVHLFHTIVRTPPKPVAAEVNAWCWLAADALREDVMARPENYSAWFRIYLDQIPVLRWESEGVTVWRRRAANFWKRLVPHRMKHVAFHRGVEDGQYARPTSGPD
jgi:isopentenyl-diphosphate delta-isomerase